MTAVPPFSVKEWLAAEALDGGHRRVAISRPLEVQCWTRTSVSEGNTYLCGDTSGLATFHEPPPKADLNAGYPDMFIRKAEGNEGADVATIIHAARTAGLTWERTTVCTFRNNLNKIALTAVSATDPKHSWAIDAVVHGGTLFLEIVKLPEDDFPNKDLFNYYGYKFEALCAGARADAPVDCTSEFATVVQLSLGRHNVLMAAEIDCCAPPRGGADGAGASPDGSGSDGGGGHRSYMELKTYRFPVRQAQEKNHVRNHYPKWWIQSFLGGVDTLVAGARDDVGKLVEVQHLPVDQLPRLALDEGPSCAFDAHRMLRFTDELLAWMAHVCAADQEHGAGPGNRHVRFTYSPAQQLVEAGLVADAPGGAGLASRVQAALQA